MKLVNTCICKDDNPNGCQDCCHGSSRKHEGSNHEPETSDISDDPQNADESERPRHRCSCAARSREDCGYRSNGQNSLSDVPIRKPPPTAAK